jgi:hypothetical protein
MQAAVSWPVARHRSPGYCSGTAMRKAEGRGGAEARLCLTLAALQQLLVAWPAALAVGREDIWVGDEGSRA